MMKNWCQVWRMPMLMPKTFSRESSWTKTSLRSIQSTEITEKKMWNLWWALDVFAIVITWLWASSCKPGWRGCPGFRDLGTSLEPFKKTSTSSHDRVVVPWFVASFPIRTLRLGDCEKLFQLRRHVCLVSQNQSQDLSAIYRFRKPAAISRMNSRQNNFSLKRASLVDRVHVKRPLIKHRGYFTKHKGTSYVEDGESNQNQPLRVWWERVAFVTYWAVFKWHVEKPIPK